MRSPVRLFGGWWLVQDTSIPSSYPPWAEEELAGNRIALDYARTEMGRLRHEIDLLVERRNMDASRATGPHEHHFTLLYGQDIQRCVVCGFSERVR